MRDTTLGRPEQLARSAWENYRASHYAVRHPLVAFLVLPIPLCLLGWTVALVSLIAIFSAVGKWPWWAANIGSKPLNAWPAAVLWIVPMLELVVRVLPPAIAALLCCAWSEQLNRAGRWRFVSCMAIAAIAGMLFSTLIFPLTPGQGHWSLGFGFPGGRDQLLQLLVPLLIGLWWTCRSRQLLATE